MSSLNPGRRYHLMSARGADELRTANSVPGGGTSSLFSRPCVRGMYALAVCVGYLPHVNEPFDLEKRSPFDRVFV